MKVDVKPSKVDTEGVWAKHSEGVRFRIARAGNPVFLKATDKLEAPYRKQLARGKLSTEKQIDLQCRAMAEGILLDWEGIETADGPLEYTVDNAAAVLRHNSEIRDFVFEFATEQENYRTQEIKDTAKK